jgi:16S rRNA A1518/A1519 N6-dimethyltransferase RsmA/KsgA/DIM1 with predicted DNA glycosylase/AP lyase activity
VNRDDIRKDFETRSLHPPLEIIHGDSMKYEIRQQARRAIGGGAFDCIVTDPPYGIR